MLRAQTDHTWAFFRLDPDRSHAAKKRERIFADYFTGALERKHYRALAKGRIAPYSSVTFSTTRVMSIPSATNS